ncbi:DUF4240 domain-containing protein [Spirillospora sp. NPDC047279]|uniref:DUF4240 domain-containing protein n=1 Tax=Spirillospora sp. NPDC047279 TaxID=3155478 RepID=UPI0033CBB1A1
MDTTAFWALIDEARAQTPAYDHEYERAEAVAAAVTRTLTTRPLPEIIAAQQTLWDLLSDSYRNPLWAAAYLINGGCSDDGFDYFRGWLITQGQEVHERAVADPDSLADLPVVQEAAEELECEATLAIAWDAYRKAAGEDLPPDSYTIRYRDLERDWNFDFDDTAEMKARLPRLAALYLS